MSVDLTGQPLIIVLLIAAIVALATAVAVLWKAFHTEKKRGDDAWKALVNYSEQSQEKYLAQSKEVNETVRVLNDVFRQTNAKGE